MNIKKPTFDAMKYALEECNTQALDANGDCSFCHVGGVNGGHDKSCAIGFVRAALIKAREAR